MAKKQEQKDEVIVDIGQVYSRSEELIEKYKKSITYVIGAILLVVVGYFGYVKLYLEPLEQEAQAEIFKAEKYFEIDSLNQAVNGDGVSYGFVDIVDIYAGTKSANLAHYYLGICYLRMGMFEEAIDELEDFSSSDVMLSSIALGAQGDAYMELGETETAIDLYKQAADVRPNKFTSPLYLMKSGQALESIEEYDEAVAAYEKIKEEYPESQERREIEKFIARAGSFVN